MTPQDMDALMDDNQTWPPTTPTHTASSLPTPSHVPLHQHIHSSPEQVQQLALHHHSPAASVLVPHAPAVKQEPLSPVQQHQLLQTYQPTTTPQHQFVSPSPHSSLVAHNSLSPHPPPNTASVSQGFSLPQTIAGSHDLTHAQQQQQQQQLHHYHTPEQQLQSQISLQASVRSPSADESVDHDKYVRMASETAEQAKLEHRTLLKDQQRRKELAAENKGEPLSAKDKERERSRRESAVTRKRAEVYIHELERIVRTVPDLENKIARLQLEVTRLTNSHPPQLSTPRAVSAETPTKSEPTLVLSPDSTNTNRVVNSLTRLDL